MFLKLENQDGELVSILLSTSVIFMSSDPTTYSYQDLHGLPSFLVRFRFFA
jgi:hypothetical protein